jgi:hypothetical protein
MSNAQKIPTPGELNELPRWALVAFALCCAREALETITPKTGFRQAADDAIQCAYYSTVLPPQTDDFEMQVAFEMATEVTQSSARRSYKNRGKPKVSTDEDGLDIARSALQLSTLAKSNAKREMLVSMSASTIAKLQKLARAKDTERIASLLRERFRKLATAAKKEEWDDNSKIPDKFL